MSQSNPDQALIQQLIQQHGGSDNADLVEDIIETALRLADDKADRLDVKVITSALKELRYASKIFAPFRGQRKVTVFGSARTKPETAEYKQAVAFGKVIVDHGFMVITGGGEGIMGAAQHGAGRDKSFGLNIRLPFEQEPNIDIVGDRKLINFKYFFTRKLCFIKESDAIVLFPGGFGTHDEGFEALTLMQTGKSQPKPLVFVDRPRGNYWKTWWRFVEDQLLDEALISKEDLSLFKVTDDVEEACQEIMHFYSNYHSSRYVKDAMVLRVKYPVTENLLRTLNARFANICVNGGQFRAAGPLPEEENEPELKDLHRIVFPFNRTNFGRLRSLIDVINHH
ncbi:MAG TPA: TIGR00730 family Rossman fold protein [Verrucomicrobiae bacterium]|nr:TIGR00730 family Rossman fold protein [Verrucomicrobiae bacterium]